mmetsp:Transcript_32747/g.90451  ORF Transcript_32747/g.90451 Transcript_32747/m.90451 type:complete len:213 (-) Transcript_32747:1170-1808(-)
MSIQVPTKNFKACAPGWNSVSTGIFPLSHFFTHASNTSLKRARSYKISSPMSNSSSIFKLRLISANFGSTWNRKAGPTTTHSTNERRQTRTPSDSSGTPSSIDAKTVSNTSSQQKPMTKAAAMTALMRTCCIQLPRDRLSRIRSVAMMPKKAKRDTATANTSLTRNMSETCIETRLVNWFPPSTKVHALAVTASFTLIVAAHGDSWPFPSSC